MGHFSQTIKDDRIYTKNGFFVISYVFFSAMFANFIPLEVTKEEFNYVLKINYVILKIEAPNRRAG